MHFGFFSLSCFSSFQMLNVWLNKILGWGLFGQVLGPDFATELVVYYKDRGSYLFNAGCIGLDALPRHAKYLPGIFLRDQRFAVVRRKKKPDFHL